MLVGQFKVPCGGEGSKEVDFEFVVVGLDPSVPSAAGFELESPAGVEAVEDVKEEGVSAVGNL